MAYFKTDEIAGYYVGNEIICTTCITDAELEQVTEKDVILTETVINDEEGIYFCDRTGERLVGFGAGCDGDDYDENVVLKDKFKTDQ
ncbi:MAG: hypothetical protein JRH18_08920 [Deltaproteobacteria bacterium]|nr:hypothetical protein [Deltaproteobacteria bacterium]MBW2151775.1 hypothetical protein [Deltaproteobacteria bacterium]